MNSVKAASSHGMEIRIRRVVSVVALSCLTLAPFNAMAVGSTSEAFAALRSGDPAKKQAAVSYLKNAGRKGLWAIEAELKGSSEPAQKAPIVEMLGEFQGDKDAEFMLHVTMKHLDAPEIIAAACRASGKLKVYKARVLGYLSHPSPMVREAVIDAMKSYGVDSVTANVVEAMRSSDVNLRIGGLEAAGALNLQQYAQQVVIAMDDLNPAVAAAAARGIGTMNYLPAVPKLEAMSRSVDRSLAMAAVSALSTMRSVEAEEALNRFLLGKGADEVKLAALQVIKQRGRDGVEVMLSALPSASDAVKAEIERIILRDGRSDIIKDLGVIVGSPVKVRSHSAAELLVAAGKPGEDQLFNNLRDPSQAISDNTRDYMVEYGAHFVGRLNSELATADDIYAITICGVLGRIKEQSSLEPLMKVAQGVNIQVRRAAVDALTNYGTEGALRALEPLTDDADSYIRRAIIKSALKVNSPVSIEILRKALTDADLETRLTAIRALGKTKAAEAVPDLAALLATAQGYERRTIVEALGMLNQPEGDAILLDLASSDDDEEVRRLAEIGLER